MPSIVEVTNLENGRVLQLRVNDRGPFARGRILDVSRRGAQLLGFEGQGTAKVRVRILVPESIQVAALARRIGGEPIPIEQAKAAPRGTVVAEALPAALGTVASPVVPASPPTAPPPTALPRGNRQQTASSAQLAAVGDELRLPDQVSVVPVKPTQIYVQAGSFSRQDNADRVRQKLDPIGPVKMTGTRVSGVQFYRVRVGPIPTVDEADSVLARVVAAGITEARIVVD
jgi:rare lipoprotein A